MKFKCKVCPSEHQFNTEKEVLTHFKSIHRLTEKSHEFPCIMNNSCQKQYLTIKGLKQHAKNCIPEAENEDVTNFYTLC